jgi:hypothetical protein
LTVNLNRTLVTLWPNFLSMSLSTVFSYYDLWKILEVAWRPLCLLCHPCIKLTLLFLPLASPYIRCLLNVTRTENSILSKSPCNPPTSDSHYSTVIFHIALITIKNFRDHVCLTFKVPVSNVTVKAETLFILQMGNYKKMFRANFWSLLF